MEQILESLRAFLWSWPLLLLFFFTGGYLTFLLKGVQFRYLGYALCQVIAPSRRKAVGDISHFEALMTTLAGAIGTGSIVGVATGIAMGGLGSIFWMWVTALFGMATKYGESLLAVKFRSQDERGEMLGGPMAYMEKGLNMRWLALLFCSFAVVAAIGTGNLVQANAIAGALQEVWKIDPWVSGSIVSLLCGLVIVGGVKSIGRVAGIMVPFMALFYIGGGLIVITMYYDRIPDAFAAIFEGAFTPMAACGGILSGGILVTISTGVARSVFSNEAGLGITSIAAAAAITDSPGRQAMITMTGALLSTLVVCTITGLVLATSGVCHLEGVSGATMAIAAFRSIANWGEYIVSIGLILFAFSTIIAWAYYGEKCSEYLFGEKSVFWYRVIYTLCLIPGAALNIEMAWHFADISNALMAIPNLITLLALSSLIKEETNRFLIKIKEEKK
jgi:AGCS family alanine or glycine:cation symporter